MLITVLETGRPPAPLDRAYPGYPDMFARLLAPLDPDLRFRAVPLCDCDSAGEVLPDARDCEAILITGSPAGVYDPLPWMDPLRAFIRNAHALKRPMVGVCFGHQIMADALGGVVRKSDKGWGVGRHVYDVIAAADWMDPPPMQFALAASHQDQIIAPPPRAATLARSAHTAHALLAYDDGPFMSLQGHPEFPDDFAADLYRARRGGPLPETLADAAVASLAAPADNGLVAGWMLRVLKGAS